MGVLKPYFDRLAKMVLKGHTIILKKQTLRQQLQQKAGELGVKTAAKYMVGPDASRVTCCGVVPLF